MKIIYVILQTEWQLFILSILVLGLTLFKKLTWAQWVGILSLSYLILLCKTPLVDNWLEKLENEYPPLELTALDTSYGYRIVILGSGATYDPDIPPNSWLDAVLAKRFLEGLKWQSQLPHSTIAGMASSLESSISQAEMVAKTALLFGVPPSDTLQIPQPTNTKEEAHFLFQRIGAQTIILSTSAFHMPRAKKWFEKEGFKVIPAPTDYRIKKDPKGSHRSWAWNWDRIDYWNILIHEWAGAFHYWLSSSS
jgi:uncharacterized SAM-binding protein YcdF (DUF218 family)